MEDIDLKIKVSVQEAESNLDSLNNKIDEVQENLEEINDTVDEGTSSVGGLDKAFESAFNTIAKEGGKSNSALGKTLKTVKDAIPVIKTVNSTAIAGLKGIKAALASTGIGAVVVALGLIVSHWEDIVRWTGIGTEKQREYEQAVQDSEKAMDDLNWQHQVEIRLLKAKGASENEIADAKVRQAIQTRDEQAAQDQLLISLAKNRREQKRLTEEARERWEINNEAIKQAEKERDVVKQEVQLREEARQREERSRNRSSKTVKEEVVAEESKLDIYKKQVTEAQTLYDNLEAQKELEEEITNQKRRRAEQQLQYISDRDVENLAKVTVEYRKQAAVVDQAIKEADKLDPGEKAEEIAKWNEVALRLEEDVYRKFKEIYTEAATRGTDIIYEDFNRFIDLAQDSIGLDVAFEGYGEKLESNIKGVVNQTAKYYELEIARIQKNLEFLDQWIAQEEEGSDLYSRLVSEREDLVRRSALVEAQGVEDIKKALHEELGAYLDYYRSLADIFGTIAEMEEERIQRMVDQGKITEDEAKRQFETMKGWQYAQTWINTLAGMTAALTAPTVQSMGIPGWIAAAAQAASLLAQGIAQTAKIKNTQFGGGSTGGGVSSPNVGVTPLKVINDVQKSPVVPVEKVNPEDQRVWILQSDLEDSHRQVAIRESNSTF